MQPLTCTIFLEIKILISNCVHGVDKIIILLKNQNMQHCVYMHLKKDILILYIIIVECDKGLYGIGCSETCGHCRDVNQCFHINGTCLTGCDAGYKGDLCKTGR